MRVRSLKRTSEQYRRRRRMQARSLRESSTLDSMYSLPVVMSVLASDRSALAHWPRRPQIGATVQKCAGLVSGPQYRRRYRLLPKSARITAFVGFVSFARLIVRNPLGLRALTPTYGRFRITRMSGVPVHLIRCPAAHSRRTNTAFGEMNFFCPASLKIVSRKGLCFIAFLR